MAGEMSVRIGQRIRTARLATGLNQRELALKINEAAIEADLTETPIDNQRISDWERGINKPSERYMDLLSRALDKRVSWFYETDDPKANGTPDPFAGQDQAQLDRIEEQLTANARALEVLLGGLANGGTAEEPALARALDHLIQLRQRYEAPRRTA